MESAEIARRFLAYFERARAHDRPLGSAWSPTTPRCCSSSPGCSRSSRTCSASRPRRSSGPPDVPEVRAHPRHRRGRQDHPARHVLPDAGQLVVRRLLQGQAIPFAWELLTTVRAGRRVRLPRGPAVGRPCCHDDDEALRHLAGRGRRAGEPHPAPRAGRQLLAHGRARPGRPLLGDLLRPGRRSTAGRAARRPTRTATWRCGTSSSCRTCSARCASKEDFDIAGPLPFRNVDTGMGLERMAAILQGVDNIYEIDTTWKILDRAAELTEQKYGQRPPRSTSRCGWSPTTCAARDAGRRRGAAEQRGTRLRAAPDPAPQHPQPAAAGRRPARRRAATGPATCTSWATPRSSAMADQFPELRRDAATHPRRDRRGGGGVPRHAAHRHRDLRRRGGGDHGARSRQRCPASRRSSCTTPTASRSTSPWRWRQEQGLRSTRRASGG